MAGPGQVAGPLGPGFPPPASRSPSALAGRLEAAAFALLVAAIVSAPLGPNLHLPGHMSVFLYRVLWVAFVLTEGLRLFLLRHSLPRPDLGDPATLWLAIIPLAAISLLWAHNLNTGVRHLLFLIQGAVLVLAVSGYGRSARRLAIMLGAAAVTLLAVLATAVVERKTGYHLPASMFRDLTMDMMYPTLFSAFFYNPNGLATFLALWLPLLLVAYLEAPAAWQRLVAAALVALAGFLIIADLSRANAIAAMLSILVLFAFSVRGRFVAWGMLGALAAAIAFAAPLGLRLYLGMATREIGKAFTASEILSDSRAKMAHGALVLLRQTRGLGVGIGNTEARLVRVYPGAEHAPAMRVHNWWLEVLTDLGVVGFALYVTFYLRLLAGLLRRHLALPRDGWSAVSLGLFASLVGFMVGCVSNSSQISFDPMYLCFGLGAAVMRLPLSGGAPRRARA